MNRTVAIVGQSLLLGKKFGRSSGRDVRTKLNSICLA
jgi:hypothetical protein